MNFNNFKLYLLRSANMTHYNLTSTVLTFIGTVLIVPRITHYTRKERKKLPFFCPENRSVNASIKKLCILQDVKIGSKMSDTFFCAAKDSMDEETIYPKFC